jgi:hypothetical protein
MRRQLVVNALIKYKDSERIERILWFDKVTNVITLINVFDNSWPYFQEYSYIEELIRQDNIEMIDNDPFVRIINENEISEKEKAKRDSAWEIINYMYSKLGVPKIFIIEGRREVLNKTIAEFNVSRNTIDNYLKRFFKRGQVKNTLLSDYVNCGGAGKEKKITDKKRGRPLKIKTLSSVEGINIDDNIKRIFRITINKYYNTSKKNPLTTVYELMIRDYFSEEYEDKSGKKRYAIAEQDKVPTLQQFRYWFNKERNIKKEKISRYSFKEYELKSRAIMGKTRSDGLYPTAKYQIDATIADVYIVSRYNREWIIGRPVTYFAIDTYSSMVVGLSVTLEGPSFLGAMCCLVNSFSNKKEFCKQYDVDIENEDWPVGYIPDTIICDRGELLGEGIETLINNLGVTVENTASFRGDMKALVERFFKTIHSRVKPFVPGFIDSDFRKRGGKDYRLDAKLDIYQFTQIMIKCVLHHNNNAILSEYDRDTLMIKDSVEPIPIKLWNWGIINKSGTLRKVNDNVVKLSLMPKDTATVTERGIRLKGMYYGSETAIKERWFEKARVDGHWKINVSYDPRSMENIYMVYNNGKNYEKCTLLQHQSRYINKTLEEIEYLLSKEKLIEKENSGLQSKIDLYSDIEDIVKEAVSMTQKNMTFNDSNTSKIKGIRSNREIEKAVNRKNDVFTLDDNADITNSEIKNIQADGFEADDIAVLRKRLNERKGKYG